eukprot:CAMPEP_0198525276 /NCGR_PEP_ID=MMETSP1462-20131121/23265_1 /TAXON_ID=1333877 /ORGANISM="Brandtodinium nutriculum, Strain RCC3387" /LENGTH=49 /DNA_ID= /DNA_START= /DNA_END= /DNA_ORIENTATION=
MASVPPVHPATFFTKTAFSILMRRNLTSAGFFSTFSVTFNSDRHRRADG